jgi:Xaa-Pro aminopeptidase
MADQRVMKMPVTISTPELERRWREVRQAMKQRDLDFLIFQNCATNLGGYVKWFTDLQVMNGYTSTVIFPRDDEMITIWHGGRPPSEPFPPPAMARGIKKRIGVPLIPSLGYSSVFDAEHTVAELSPHKNCKIGLVGMGLMAAAFYKYVTDHLTGARFEDASDLVDEIKAIKSDEEIALIRDTCELQDAIFDYTLTLVAPGKVDADVRREVIHRCIDWGADDLNIMTTSAGAGEIPRMGSAPRVMGRGDQFIILIETNGPSRYWGELCRTICIGEIHPAIQGGFNTALEAQQVTLNLMKAGTAPKSLFQANNDFLRSKGCELETRIYGHGQGYDMVERPSLDGDEPMRIQPRMLMAVHPSAKSAKAFAFICDNYIVGENGKHQHLHKTPQKIFVV